MARQPEEWEAMTSQRAVTMGSVAMLRPSLRLVQGMSVQPAHPHWGLRELHVPERLQGDHRGGLPCRLRRRPRRGLAGYGLV